MLGDKLKKQKKETRELLCGGDYKMVSPREGYIKIRLVGKKRWKHSFSGLLNQGYKDEWKESSHNSLKYRKGSERGKLFR